MQLLEKIRSNNFLRNIFLVKIVALVAIWIAMDRGFTFGDKILSAADEKAATEAPANPDEAAKDATATSGEPAKVEEAAKPRRSFLANLLDLPNIETSDLKKDEINRYLEIAERKKRQIADRLDILQRREDQLTALESSIDEKLKRLDEERRYLAQTIQKEKELKGERLDKLVTLYAKMEPKKAGPIFEKLDKDLVVELFKQIPQKQVTTIMETMTPEKSVELSEYYGRVRSAREYDLLKEMNQSLRKEFEDCKGMPPPSAVSQAPAKAGTISGASAP